MLLAGRINRRVALRTLEDMGQRFVDAWHRAERGEAVSERGNPTLKTTLAVMKALGIDLTAKPAG